MFGKIYDVLGESLNVLDDRQNLIASDIANANTPGYKAKTLDFKNIMNSMVSSSDSGSLSSSPESSFLPMTVNSPSDLSYSGGSGSSSASGGSGLIDSFVKEQTDESVPPLDGNTVDLSKEMTDMTSNAIRFQAVSGILSKKFTLLNYAITQTNP